MINKDLYMDLKRKCLENEFKAMNSKQKEAIFNVNGPVLILAGAGSGKTTVIVNRIAYMLKHGNAYFEEDFYSQNIQAILINYSNDDCGNFLNLPEAVLKFNPPRPCEILAITFTNKAAGELCARLQELLGDYAKDINAGTFHSQCIKILVKYIKLLNYESNFTIYDSEDSKKLIKIILDELNIDDKILQPKSILYGISKAKNMFLYPDEYEKKIENSLQNKRFKEIYRHYQKNLEHANALDFDDIVCLTVKLFKNFPEILEKYREKFKYIMVDEYQDTNPVQYELIKLLAGKNQNLCVVGDDDQSIYKFRGAAIENILNFEKHMKNVKTIRLEQNYRSTQNILSAANSIIANNSMRKGKKIWTDNGNGEKVAEVHLSTESDEAKFVCEEINKNIANGMQYKDHVILYRTNMQSANIERFLIAHSIPYKIIGSTKFYERKEIKDILAYLTVINNKDDDLRLVRIINEPKRGIGENTISKLKETSENLNVSIFEIISKIENYPIFSRKAVVLKSFHMILVKLMESVKKLKLSEFFDELVEKTGYRSYLLNYDEKAIQRIENLEELKSNLKRYEDENEGASLSGFLGEIALYTDVNEYNTNDDKISLMTFHSAKGLEFPIVFMVGMDDGIFPGNKSIEKVEDLEEERRLAYVGVTRAKKKLYMLTSSQRMIFGSIKFLKPSRFLSEIPDDFKEILNFPEKKRFDSVNLMNINKMKINLSDYDRNRVKKSAESVEFYEKEIVIHSVFGKGKIVKITPVGNDRLMEIDFFEKGKKKIMANYAKLKKTN